MIATYKLLQKRILLNCFFFLCCPWYMNSDDTTAHHFNCLETFVHDIVLMCVIFLSGFLIHFFCLFCRNFSLVVGWYLDLMRDHCLSPSLLLLPLLQSSVCLSHDICATSFLHMMWDTLFWLLLSLLLSMLVAFSSCEYLYIDMACALCTMSPVMAINPFSPFFFFLVHN